MDDGSHDDTAKVAAELGLTTFVHRQNLGYGRNQKTCYREALRRGADIVIMLHPDYQYSPNLIVSLAGMIAFGEYDVALGLAYSGSRRPQGRHAPLQIHFQSFLTLIQNLLMKYKLSEYHTGYRAFSRTVLDALPLEANTDDFAFDNQMLAQIIFFGYRMGEVSCPTRYFPEAPVSVFRAA